MLLVSLGVTAPAVAAPTLPPRSWWQAQHVAPYHVDVVQFSAVGDSITAPEVGGVPREGLSWLYWTSDTVSYVDGWAFSGMTTQEMYAGVGQLHGDVLVIVAGTNDAHNGVSYDSYAYIEGIAADAGIGRVVLSAIAPANPKPAAALAFNAGLLDLAARHGWTFVDPWTQVRAGDGTYITGSTYDGRHPTAETQAVTGAILSAAIYAAGQVPTLKRL